MVCFIGNISFINKFCKFTYFIVDYVKEDFLCIIMAVAEAALIKTIRCHIMVAVKIMATLLWQLF